jgi:RHS repeat-associated protein
MVAESRHYPYGEERWHWPQEGTFLTDYRFTGQELVDSAGGINHMGARFYDPALGRWVSADTLVRDPGSLQSFNLYAYIGNRTLNHAEPSGHTLWRSLPRGLDELGVQP